MGLIPRQTITVTRESGGTRIDGKWVSGSTSNFTIEASIQPLTAREIQLLPESRRASGESYKLFADTTPALYTVTDDENPDRVSLYSQNFEIYSVKRWENSIINHKEYIATRITTK